jgi:hypothetical protein
VVKENVIKQVMASLKCDVCRQPYEPDNVTVIGHQGDLWFLKVFCPTCHTQYLVAVVVKEGEAPEVITDLTEEELDKFKDAVGLTADEILDMHDFLKDFDGDFSRLFGRG